MKTVAERIKYIRSKSGLNQADFALKYKAKTKGSVSDWENGRSTPGMNEMYKMAKSIGKTLDWLVMGDEAEGNNDYILMLNEKEQIIEKLNVEKKALFDKFEIITKAVEDVKLIKDDKSEYLKVAEKKHKYKKRDK